MTSGATTRGRRGNRRDDTRLDCVIEGCDASIGDESEDAVLDRAAEAHHDLELDGDTVETSREQIEEP